MSVRAARRTTQLRSFPVWQVSWDGYGESRSTGWTRCAVAGAVESAEAVEDPVDVFDDDA